MVVDHLRHGRGHAAGDAAFATRHGALVVVDGRLVPVGFDERRAVLVGFPDGCRLACLHSGLLQVVELLGILAEHGQQSAGDVVDRKRVAVGLAEDVLLPLIARDDDKLAIGLVVEYIERCVGPDGTGDGGRRALQQLVDRCGRYEP